MMTPALVFTAAAIAAFAIVWFNLWSARTPVFDK
jgi:hypothetical protein